MPFMRTSPASRAGILVPVPSRTMFENLPGRVQLTLDQEFFKALEDYIMWAQNVPRKIRQADDHLARFLALSALGIAQKLSGGPKRSPSHKADPRAWRPPPIPRITWAYYFGWQARRLQHGTWILTNVSREAYYIEFGIHRNPRTGEVAPRRIRRPVMKLTFKKTLEFMQSTAIAHRIFADVYFPKPGEPGRRSRNLIWYMQSPGVMRQMFGDHFPGGSEFINTI